MNKNDLVAAARVLHEGETFLLAGHVSPDGDCLGSMSALTLALTALGKKAFPVSMDGVPELYRFIPGSERILSKLPQVPQFDVGIALDSDRLDRLGPAGKGFADCKELLVIDHHLGYQWDRGVKLADSSSASCGEIVYELLLELGVKLNREIAEGLLTAIVTDTGTFRFQNVKPSTLRIAAELMECGAAPGTIAERVYESRTLAGARLLGETLTNLATTDDGRIAYAFITREQMESTGAGDSDVKVW